ncbi:MAG TPA: Hpt domain-containing protein [Terriglobia bacterium]|nr:Hpt domain-containing protein [Terriglobia bacterium]
MDNVIINMQALEDRVGGDPELLAEIIQIFFDRSPDVIANMRRAIGSHDAKGLEATAHSLRGYLVNFHAERASGTALELEIKGRQNDWLQTEETFSNLQRDVELLRPRLTALLHRIESPSSWRM